MDKNTTAGKVGEHPPHYLGKGGIGPFAVIDAFDLDFYLGNALKYILRADRKGSKVNDLEKAKHYIEEAIIRARKESES